MSDALDKLIVVGLTPREARAVVFYLDRGKNAPNGKYCGGSYARDIVRAYSKLAEAVDAEKHFCCRTSWIWKNDSEIKTFPDGRSFVVGESVWAKPPRSRRRVKGFVKGFKGDKLIVLERISNRTLLPWSKSYHYSFIQKERGLK